MPTKTITPELLDKIDAAVAKHAPLSVRIHGSTMEALAAEVRRLWAIEEAAKRISYIASYSTASGQHYISDAEIMALDEALGSKP